MQIRPRSGQGQDSSFRIRETMLTLPLAKELAISGNPIDILEAQTIIAGHGYSDIHIVGKKRRFLVASLYTQNGARDALFLQPFKTHVRPVQPGAARRFHPADVITVMNNLHRISLIIRDLPREMIDLVPAVNYFFHCSIKSFQA